MQIQLDRPLYTVSETLALLKIGRTKFYEEVAVGRMKAVKSGQRTLVPAQSIKDWIDALPALSCKKH